MQQSTFRQAAIAGLLFALGTASPALAQPAGNEMCGTGTTFAVSLPVVDNNPGGGLVFPFATLRPDTIDLPLGCDVYVLIVSDVGRNRELNELLFYPLSKFAAQHNGYVHYAWWNNLLRPYMGGVVHQINEELFPSSISADNHPGKRFTKNAALEDLRLTDPLRDEHEVYQSECQFTNPATGRVVGSILDVAGPAGCAAMEAAANLFYSPVLRRPLPDSMKQMVADATLVVRRVRDHNPDAVIVVAGHGLGAHAGALISGRVGTTDIDLLALIDPYASRSEPDGSEVDDSGLSGSRERALRPIAGYARRDCVRSNFFVCQNFGTFFNRRYQCFTRAESLPERPLVGSFAPVHCPGPVVTYSTRRVAAKRVYHRWQGETGPPLDFNSFHGFYINDYPAALNPVTVQAPWPSTLTGAPAPGHLCGDPTVDDPLLASGMKCSPFDGHDELVGFRASRSFPVEFPPLFSLQVDLRIPYGVEAPAWTEFDISFPSARAPLRRQKLIAMAGDAEAAWPERPIAPELCLVCDDLVAITQELYDERHPSTGDPDPDVTAPTTAAVASPGSNAEGWHAGDVLVDLTVSDAGSGVREIQHSLAGAQSSGVVVTPGNTTRVTVTAEGTTALSFLGRDNAGNEEAVRTLEVKIDRTRPDIAAVIDVGPNPAGWNRTDVQVTFEASDALSGLASSSPPATVSAEGAGQEIIGTAEDKADNLAAASAVLSIDKTAPLITLAGRTPAANAEGWNLSDVTVTWNCTDTLSGPVSAAVSRSVLTEGAAQSVGGTCTDLADNTASATHGGISIDETGPTVTISTPPDGASYLLNAPIASNYTCADSLSGIGSCAGPVASGAAVNSSAVGGGTFSVIGSDVAGNSTSATHGYTVQYAFSGFGDPVQPSPTVNVVKAGRTVPVKYQLRDAQGTLISDLGSFVALASGAVACDATAPGVEVDATEAAGSTTIRYDAAGGQFVYNWKTSSAWAGSCRLLQLTLDDGTTREAVFEFR